MNYLIIGNGAAGIYAAKKIREQDQTAAIKVITADSHHFYSRPRLPEYLEDKCSLEKLLIFSEQ